MSAIEEHQIVKSPLDRVLQLSMLLEMQVAYPNPITHFEGQGQGLTDAGLANIVYLQDHGLCRANAGHGTDGRWSWGGATITAKGLDFLAEDGGLSAILGVVTIKMHADTIRDLITAKIDASKITDSEKSKRKRCGDDILRFGSFL